MSGLYYTDLLDILRGAGLTVQVASVNSGWETRSRSSGGFPSAPLCVFWHHTASSTSPENDLNYMINGSSDAPVGNMLIDRDGVCWPIAAGASNCAGKGGPASFSRGTIPADQGNTRGWQCEVANAGTGEPWPLAQLNAYFLASNAMNARFGNQPTDIITHNVWAPTRKIDPATADAVQGSWRPRSCTSSGTWHLDDVRAECAARAGQTPAPTPDEEDDDVKHYLVLYPGSQGQYVTDLATFKTFIPTPEVAWEGITKFGWICADSKTGEPISLDPSWTSLLDGLPTP